MKRNFIARCKKHLCVETKTDIVIFNVLLFAPCLGTLELGWPVYMGIKKLIERNRNDRT